MELDLQSLFGLLRTAVLIGWEPAIPHPPPPPALGSYTRALLVSQDRRHLFVIVTPWVKIHLLIMHRNFKQSIVVFQLCTTIVEIFQLLHRLHQSSYCERLLFWRTNLGDYSLFKYWDDFFSLSFGILTSVWPLFNSALHASPVTPLMVSCFQLFHESLETDEISLAVP